MHQEEDPRTPLYTFVAYLLLGSMTITVMLLVIAPFFLSGLHLSPIAIVSHEAASKDFSWYPLFGSEGLQSEAFRLGAFACFSTPCVALPLLVAAIWELAYSWRMLHLHQKLLRLMLIVPATTTMAVLIVWAIPLLDFTLGYLILD